MSVRLGLHADVVGQRAAWRLPRQHQRVMLGDKTALAVE